MRLGSIEAVITGINSAEKILIMSHEKPDGDAIGSSLALSRILNNNGKEATLVGFNPIAKRYNFLIDDYEIKPADSGLLSRYDTIIILDCGDISRAGEFAVYAQGRIPVINIDHHRSNTDFGKYNWVDPYYSSTGEMIFNIAKKAGMNIPENTANPFWVAISTDTGNFNYSNTSSNLLRMAAEVIDLGADPSEIYKNLYESIEKKELELQRLILDSLKIYAGNKIAILSVVKDDFSDTGCTPQHLHDPVNIGLSIDGVVLSAFIYEQPFDDAVKISLRSYHPYDVAQICREFGGGGHARAAGCRIKGKSIDEVLNIVQQRLEKEITKK